jgi:5'-deoxynucleotidase YfbR-like HD superfamily hydrolase
MIPNPKGASMTRRGDWMQTFSGVHFYPFNPKPEDVRIEDIAHALSNICRFSGHTRKFYSVAQHSVLVCRALAGESALLQRWGLMHDAAEAYINDLIRPLKHTMFFNPPDDGTGNDAEAWSVAEIEELILQQIAAAFGMEGDGDHYSFDKVIDADRRALVTERRDLIFPDGADWSVQAAPFVERIDPWSPTHACQEFLAEALRLGLPMPFDGKELHVDGWEQACGCDECRSYGE